MSTNASDKPVFEEPDFRDMDAIGDVPRFAPPEPNVLPEASSLAADNANNLTSALPEAAPQVVVTSGDATNEAATVVLNDEGTTVPVSVEPATSPVVADGAENEPLKSEDGATPKADAAAEEVIKDSTAEKEEKPIVGQEVNPLKALEDQIKAVAASILAERGPDALHSQALLNEGELARVAQHLNLQGGARPDLAAASLLQPIGATPAPNNASTVGLTAGQSVQVKGGAAVAEGIGALVGGALNLAGTAGKVVGQAAHHVADLMKGQDANRQAEAVEAEATSGLPAVLPRLSEYRIAQVEKAASTYGQEADAFWNSSTKLTALRSEMERVARERGLSVQDVAEKMKPGGDFADLRKDFNAAVSENPDAGARKKAMDKALDSYVRQYGRAQEELLNPEQHGNPHYDRYKDRLKRAHEDIEQNASGIPAFANSRGELESSHFEKLKEAVEKILEKLKEVAKEFLALFRSKTADDDHAPAP